MVDLDLSGTIKCTSQYFSSLVELIPAKYFVENEDQPKHNGMKKKLKPENKKLLAKKAKLLKLDPTKHKTISELQQEIELKENELLENESIVDDRIQPVKVSTGPSASIEELRERLHAKMKHLQGKRKMLEGEDKVNYKKSRIEQKAKDNTKNKKLKENSNIKRANEVEEKSIEDSSKIKNARGEIVFSKFDFAGDMEGHKKNKKKNMKTLLHIAEKRQEKIKDLQETDSVKASDMKKKIAWDNAVKKAEGVKLKDDPKLLKKSIKRKEKLKERSSKKWKERIENVEKQKIEKQKLRKEHLKERKEEHLNKKKGLKKKKKKSKPGF